MTTRRSARIAQKKTSIQPFTTKKPSLPTHQKDAFDAKTPQSKTGSTDIEFEVDDSDRTRPPKRRNIQQTPKPLKPPILNLKPTTQHSTPPPTPSFPSRTHTPTYHRPLLLSSPTARTSLLTWYTTTASPLRCMPWRKPFLHPSDPATTPSALAQRAYEVWISEVMLQQTRVQTAVSYWERWMARWPTIEDLARAEVDEVLGVWAGLGYYGRARRVWEAARMVVGEYGGMMPKDVMGLMKVPGVGRYTAGAVAAIVFGVVAPMVDGNVLRVLSRQMGILGDVKGDKRVIGVLWDAAEEVVKVVARDGEEEGPNEKPGMWGQALMELGSTVCVPKPKCTACPITGTCRAYAEGVALAEKGEEKAVVLEDIEDFCTLCTPFEEAMGEGGNTSLPNTSKGTASGTAEGLSPFFLATKSAKSTKARGAARSDPQVLETIINHAKKFPLKKPKMKVREEEILVCAIRLPDGRYLIHRRPEKGLLAGMWELPSHTLPKTNDSTGKSRATRAAAYVSELTMAKTGKWSKPPRAKHLGELGSIPWLFSHLKLTMHVHLFQADDGGSGFLLDATHRWASSEEIASESMGTGMRKCWSLVMEQST